ncbi:hypothetical protein D3C72_1662430 [compost metagenome]
MAAGTRADLALPLGVGQVFIAGDIAGLDRGLVVGDHAAARREAEPLAIGIAVVGGDARFKHLGLDRREHAGLLGPPQPADIDGDEHVGRAVGAFIADALQQRVFLAFDAVDLDAGLLGEVGVQRLVRLVVPRGVEVEHLFLGSGCERQRQDGECRGARQQGSDSGLHADGSPACFGQPPASGAARLLDSG